MLNISDAALRRLLTAERMDKLGLRKQEPMTDEELRNLLTQERMSALGLRNTTPGDDPYDHLPLIEFMCDPGLKGVIPEPVLAKKRLPDWFKKVPAELPEPVGDEQRDNFGAPALTAKKCLPMLDAMTIGYIMPLYADMTLRTTADGRHMELISPPGESVSSTHRPFQLGGMHSPTWPSPAVKFHNPWVIKTRPGWSTLFIPPINRLEEKRFTCLAAMVDTDVYPKQVNFPAVWHERPYDDIILAGTPLVLAIPVRRSTLQDFIHTRTLTREETETIFKIERAQNTRRHHYTHELRDEVRGQQDV